MLPWGVKETDVAAVFSIKKTNSRGSSGAAPGAVKDLGRGDLYRDIRGKT